MVFRKVTAEQYAKLIEFCTYEDVQYEIKTVDNKILLFGLPQSVWYRLYYSNFGETVLIGSLI